MNAEDMSPDELRALADKKERIAKHGVRPTPRAFAWGLIGDDYKRIYNVTEGVLDAHDPDVVTDTRLTDIKQVIFELVMTMVYGNDVFKWMNKNPPATDYD